MRHWQRPNTAHLLIVRFPCIGLSDATSIIVTGGSAGGLATFLHVDWIASQFPSAGAFLLALQQRSGDHALACADVRAVTDCGFFVDSSNVWGHSFTTEEYAYVARMQASACGYQVYVVLI